MKNMLTFVMIFMIFNLTAKEYSLESPSGRLSVKISVEGIIHYSVSYKGTEIISPSPVSLTLDGIILGRDAKVRRDKIISVNQEIIPVVARKNERIQDNYNQLTLSFTNYNLH